MNPHTPNLSLTKSFADLEIRRDPPPSTSSQFPGLGMDSFNHLLIQQIFTECQHCAISGGRTSPCLQELSEWGGDTTSYYLQFCYSVMPTLTEDIWGLWTHSLTQ